jgi:large subunit ribosomal protein L22
MTDDEKTRKDDQKDAPEAEGKPRRRRRRKAEDEGGEKPTATASEEATEAEAEDAPDAEAGEKPEEKPEKKAARRRGSAETTAAAAKRPAPRREHDGAVVVSARARYVRGAPRKARLVMGHIRGKPVPQARAILGHTPRAASEDVLKLLESAVSNAENNYELAADELRVGRAYVDEGPTIKRYRPRALGRATRINKRTSHMTIELTTSDASSGGS